MIDDKDNLPELPKSWKWMTLENCVDILDSKRIPVNSRKRKERIAGKPESELYPYYGATGKVGWIDDYLFDEELVLLGEDGAPFLEPAKSKAYIIKGKSWVNNHAHVLRAIDGITLNRFLCHYLNIFDYSDYLTGTTRLKLNQSRMKKISVPIPPLAEQHRIVDKVEEFFSKLDAGVKSLKKAKAQLKRYRQSVLKSAMEGKLTKEWREEHKDELEPASVLLERIKKERKSEKRYKFSLPETSDLYELPEGWLWTILNNISEIILGQSPPSSTYNEEGEGLPFYQGKSEFGKIYPTPQKWCSKPKKVAKKEDVLISIRAPVGPTNICPEKSCIGRGLAAIRGLGGIEPLFILYLMRAFEEVISGRGTGTTFKAIRSKQLRGFEIPLPPLAEQNKIVEEIERRFSVVDEVEKVVDSELKRAERLRHSILKQAFSGKLVPQEPDDEPASVLLERIKKEKERKESVKSSKKKSKAKTDAKQLNLF